MILVMAVQNAFTIDYTIYRIGQYWYVQENTLNYEFEKRFNTEREAFYWLFEYLKTRIDD